jgi:hypothetical protein
MANQDVKETSTPTSSTSQSQPSNSIATGPVSALTAGASIAGALGFNVNSGFKIPMGNPLHTYASYTQIFTLAVLTPDLIAHPEKYILKREPLPIILRSAGGNPTNRVKTPFGKFDFFINDLEIKSVYGFTQGLGNTNATLFDFTVSEPFSAGMFPIALNTAAQKVKDAKYSSFTDATFLLKIEFMGEDQNGNMIKIPNTDKFLPIKFRRVDMSVTESGATYKCAAHAAGDAPMMRLNSKLLTNLTVRGSSVQEILQRGPNSLQAVVNNRLRQIAKEGDKDSNTTTIADEVIIIFPSEDGTGLSESIPGENENDTKKSTSAPPKNDNKSTVVDNADLFAKLNVSRGDVKLNGETLIESKVNAIGAAGMAITAERQAKTAEADKDKVVEDKGSNAGKVKKEEVVKKNPKVTEFVFPQDITIQSAINQIILNSDYGIKELKAKANENGMKRWWRIETQYYELAKSSNQKTGATPKLFVYKVVPYMYHHTNFPVPGSASTTYKALLKQCVKVYNYIFTGKNQDILKFNLDFDAKFMVAITTDFGNGVDTAPTKDGKKALNDAQDGGPRKPTGQGGFNYQSTYTATHTSYDRQGMGAYDTPETKSVKMMHDALTYGSDLQNLEMDIVGDPYYLTSNGVGNYNAKPDPRYMNILSDGTINYQNGEVDIAIIFKTPLDINPSTGLYTMTGKAVGEFSGLYKLKTITHKFKDGQFTQTIYGSRRSMTVYDKVDIVYDVAVGEPTVFAGDAQIPPDVA